MQFPRALCSAAVALPGQSLHRDLARYIAPHIPLVGKGPLWFRFSPYLALRQFGVCADMPGRAQVLSVSRLFAPGPGQRPVVPGGLVGPKPGASICGPLPPYAGERGAELPPGNNRWEFPRGFPTEIT